MINEIKTPVTLAQIKKKSRLWFLNIKIQSKFNTGIIDWLIAISSNLP
jgi:hypothetical protein